MKKRPAHRADERSNRREATIALRSSCFEEGKDAMMPRPYSASTILSGDLNEDGVQPCRNL
jgi:hypothetical protein